MFYGGVGADVVRDPLLSTLVAAGDRLRPAGNRMSGHRVNVERSWEEG